jgi:uncharacterized membrane protein YoaK (UPF0700 family)
VKSSIEVQQNEAGLVFEGFKIDLLAFTGASMETGEPKRTTYYGKPTISVFCSAMSKGQEHDTTKTAGPGSRSMTMAMGKTSWYANVFVFWAGLTNSLSTIIIGVFTTHVTGAATNLGVNLAGLNTSSVAFFLGLIGSFIAGSSIATIVVGRKGLAASIVFSAALLVIVGVFAPSKVSSRSAEQFVFAFLAAVAMGGQNSSTASTPIGRTTHVTGATTEFGSSLVKMDGKNLVRLGSFIFCFMSGAFAAVLLQALIGSRSFLVAGAGLLVTAYSLRGESFKKAS